MWKQIKKIIHQTNKPVTVEIECPVDALQYIYWIDKQPLRLSLPTSMLRMQGAFTYGSNHPFVASLQYGPAKLKEFYVNFTPGNLAEMYSIVTQGKTGEDLPPWELPWLMRQQRTAPSGERGLSSSHGVSFYGPVSSEKVKLEHQRLQKTLSSIKTRGFQPDLHGDIDGHFMTNGSDVCFFVRGGKHRAAILTYLGYERIPVQLRRSWPLVIDSRSSAQWPLVTSGMIDFEFAEIILHAYLRGKNV